MATGTRSSPDGQEFVIGNRAAEMLDVVLRICSPKKGGSTFPSYLRAEYTDELIRTARAVLKDVVTANCRRGTARSDLQSAAQGELAYLTFLVRTAYNNKWISEKQHSLVFRYIGELTKRIWNWKRSDAAV